MSTDRVVIVGASHAGAQLAANLRKEKWAGDILLIGDEGRLPYQRPPLSKAYLAGDCHLDDVAIRSHQFYDKQRIQLVDGTVTSIDRAERTVTLGNNDAVSYSKLALCTGARARALPVPGADLPGVHYLRTATDVEAIRAAAVPGSRVVIVGGGYIGLETAASLRTLGVEVTVLEAAGRVLERVTAPVVSEFFDRIHREKGVDVRIDAIVEGFRGDKRVASVVLAGGETLAADLVIVGVGVIPNTELQQLRASTSKTASSSTTALVAAILTSSQPATAPTTESSGTGDVFVSSACPQQPSTPKSRRPQSATTQPVVPHCRGSGPTNTTSNSRSPGSTPDTTRCWSAATPPMAATSPATISPPEN